MKMRITSINAVAAFLLLVILNLATLDVSAQRPTGGISDDRDRGIQLYKQGDAAGAIELLRQAVKLHKEDISAWHYLGLAFAQTGKKGDALKAHEKAAKFGDDLLVSRLDSNSGGNETGHSLLAIRRS
jgi:tetratricopeptide (TPR) repeat protein